MAGSERRSATLRELGSGVLDVLVMGGGINGAGILRDLSLRAKGSERSYRFALVDRGHFSSGTSGRNSQLIHGGLRYLKNFEFQLVSEALAERATLLKTAPHLVEPLAFLIPMRDMFQSIFYETGLLLYDLLAGRNRIESHTRLSGARMRRLEPRMKHFFAGARFFDCRVHSARLVLLNLREAVKNGSIAANYVSAQAPERTSDGLWSLELEDRLSGARFAVRAHALVDATGAWSRGDQLRLVRGSHLILPRIGESENAISYFGKDGRIIFFIPWGRRHDFTLVGTTDVDHESGPDHIRISPEEVRYLLQVIEEVFPDSGPHEPICAYSSLRPLVRDESSSATKTSREHRIWADERGMIHVAGGKYTTYRRMSEEAADLVADRHFQDLRDKHLTEARAISGNTVDEVKALLRDLAALARERGLDERDVRDVINDYGVDTREILSTLPDSSPNGLTRLEAAQIGFAVRHEWTERLSDLMFVSTYWGYERRWNAETLRPFAEALGERLAWSRDRRREEIDRMLDIADQPLVERSGESAPAGLASGVN